MRIVPKSRLLSFMVVIICLSVGVFLASVDEPQKLFAGALPQAGTTTSTNTPTLTPSVTRTPSHTPTLCVTATPEMLPQVEPVTSPTNLLQQTIFVTTGNNTDRVEVTSESGTFTDNSFPYEVVIDLLPNTTHHLTVTVFVIAPNLCAGYSLSVTVDKFGAPLTIVQVSPTDTPTCTPSAGSPTLFSPSHRTHTTDTTPRFAWSNVSGFQSYRLMVYLEDRSFEYKKRVFVNNYTLTNAEALTRSRKYLWRVRTQDLGCATWSGWSPRNTLFVD